MFRKHGSFIGTTKKKCIIFASTEKCMFTYLSFGWKCTKNKVKKVKLNKRSLLIRKVINFSKTIQKYNVFNFSRTRDYFLKFSTLNNIVIFQGKYLSFPSTIGYGHLFITTSKRLDFAITVIVFKFNTACRLINPTVTILVTDCAFFKWHGKERLGHVPFFLLKQLEFWWRSFRRRRRLAFESGGANRKSHISSTPVVFHDPNSRPGEHKLREAFLSPSPAVH